MVFEKVLENNRQIICEWNFNGTFARSPSKNEYSAVDTKRYKESTFYESFSSQVKQKTEGGRNVPSFLIPRVKFYQRDGRGNDPTAFPFQRNGESKTIDGHRSPTAAHCVGEHVEEDVREEIKVKSTEGEERMNERTNERTIERSE